MIPTGFAIIMAVPIWFFGYAIGGLIEHRKSQEEISDLTERIHKQSLEQLEENNDS